MDQLMELIIRGLLWPWAWWKENNQNARLGTSPIQAEAEVFWRRFAIFGTLTLIVALIIIRYVKT